MHISILMIDDHDLILQGYQSILSNNDLGYTFTISTASNCEDAYALFTSSFSTFNFDIIFLDVTMPGYPEMKIYAGDDLVVLARKKYPKAKIVILTSHTEAVTLHKIIENCKPDGFLLKNDVNANEFLIAFKAILNGTIYYSETVKKHQVAYNKTNKLLDNYNTQIILLLSQGIQNKNIQEQLHLSKSAIDKRKVQIKRLLNIDKGNDEDIVKEARKRGLI